MWREARGEGTEGMRAVAHVICNRVGAVGFAHTLHDVIYGRNQFTSMSVSSDPEFNLAPKPGDPQYAWCVTNLPAVLSGTDLDLTHGSHYYANLAASTSGWFERVIAGQDGKGVTDHPLLALIGRQSFFK